MCFFSNFRVLENDEATPEVSTYYDYDANFGVVLNETENPSLDFEDPSLQSPRVPPSYDYSHFEVYNAVSLQTPIPETSVYTRDVYAHTHLQEFFKEGTYIFVVFQGMGKAPDKPERHSKRLKGPQHPKPSCPWNM